MEFIHQHDHIDYVLDHYVTNLGDSFTAYRNHVYRIFNLIDLLTHRNLSEKEIEKFAIASAFHDIGIWTENTLDYLDPSIALTAEYLISIHREQWQEEIEATIRWHHKITTYNGPFEESVNLFRKADWVDVTRGFRNFGVNRMEIVHLYAEFPDEGFHYFLVRRAIAFAIRNPLRPLPMFKR